MSDATEVQNGNFAGPPTDPTIPLSIDNPLPGWTVGGDATIELYWVDGVIEYRGVAAATLAEAYLEQTIVVSPVPVTQAYYADGLFSVDTVNADRFLRAQYVDIDAAATGTEGDSATSGLFLTAVPNVTGSIPSDGTGLRLRVGFAVNSGPITGAVGKAYAVQAHHGRSYTLTAELDDPSNFGPASITQIGRRAELAVGIWSAFPTDPLPAVVVDDTGVYYRDNTGAETGPFGAGGAGGAVATDTIWDAKGDLAAGTGADTASKLTVGADDTILMADSAQVTGLKYVASGTPVAVGTAAAVGTADTFTRGDHVHPHETAHVAHDTIWDTAGDLAVGSGADTAAKLGLTVPAANILNVLGVANGETTPTWKSIHDATNPAAVGTAAPGTSLITAHRDHVHATGAGTPATVGTANAIGTGPAAAMTDHVHAHEAAHINHDTTWAAKGDLIVGSANDTAIVLTVGADDTIPMADAAQATGIKWVASGTPSTQAMGDSAAVGTADTFTRGDHKHALPSKTDFPLNSVLFPATQVASGDANSLDDYEEGTFTPTFDFVTHGNLNIVYSVQVGRYLKVGNRVFWYASITTSTFTHTTASGNATIGGLPFTAANVTSVNPVGAGSCAGWTKANYTAVNPIVVLNTTTALLSAMGSGQALLNLTTAEFPTGGTLQLRLSGFYET